MYQNYSLFDGREMDTWGRERKENGMGMLVSEIKDKEKPERMMMRKTKDITML